MVKLVRRLHLLVSMRNKLYDHKGFTLQAIRHSDGLFSFTVGKIRSVRCDFTEEALAIEEARYLIDRDPELFEEYLNNLSKDQLIELSDIEKSEYKE